MVSCAAAMLRLTTTGAPSAAARVTLRVSAASFKSSSVAVMRMVLGPGSALVKVTLPPAGVAA